MSTYYGTTETIKEQEVTYLWDLMQKVRSRAAGLHSVLSLALPESRRYWSTKIMKCLRSETMIGRISWWTTSGRTVWMPSGKGCKTAIRIWQSRCRSNTARRSRHSARLALVLWCMGIWHLTRTESFWCPSGHGEIRSHRRRVRSSQNSFNITFRSDGASRISTRRF